jgi:hypothetical protein
MFPQPYFFLAFHAPPMVHKIQPPKLDSIGCMRRV